MEEILKISQRTQQQNQTLFAMFQIHPAFKKLILISNLNCINEYCEKLRFAECYEGQVVVNTGDIGELYYILIEGEIEPKLKYFGSESLLNLPYILTIKCLTKVKFATLSKQDFIFVNKRAKMKDLNSQIEFFRQSQFFGKLSKVMIEKILKNCQIEFFEKNQMIYYEGNQSDSIYLVREGLFQLSKRMTVGNKRKNIPISEIGSNELFGDLESLMNKPRYFNVKCLIQGSCFKINSEDFYYKVISDQPCSDIQRYLNDYIKAQQLSRSERIEKITQTLSFNSEYLLGLPEINTTSNKELSSIEMKILDKTHSRYAQIYNQSEKKRIKVRYATIIKTDVAVPRCSSKNDSINKTITVSIEKPIKYYPQDKIQMPDVIWRRYKQMLPIKRKNDHWIVTQNNKSSII